LQEFDFEGASLFVFVGITSREHALFCFFINGNRSILFSKPAEPVTSATF
jgi:hypothetical protein